MAFSGSFSEALEAENNELRQRSRSSVDRGWTRATKSNICGPIAVSRAPRIKSRASARGTG